MTTNMRHTPAQGVVISSVEELNAFFDTKSNEIYIATKNSYGRDTGERKEIPYKRTELFCYVSQSVAQQYLLSHDWNGVGFSFQKTVIDGVYRVEWHNA